MSTESPATHYPLERGVVGPEERRWVWRFALVVMVTTTLPYLIGFSTAQRSDTVFTGFVFGVGDGNSYIAKMLSASFGGWKFRTPYTAFPQEGAWFFIPYILLGKLAAPPALHEQLVALFHLFRWGAGLLLCHASYDFLAFFIEQVPWRRWGLFLVTLGGGLGWLPILAGQPYFLGSLPLEFISPETFGFLAVYGLPHLALARALMLWAILSYLRATQRKREPLGDRERYRLALLSGGLLFLCGLSQPLTMLVAMAVLIWYASTVGVVLFCRGWAAKEALWSFWRGVWQPLPLALGIPAILAVYYLGVNIFDPFVRQWSVQNRLPSPHWFHYVLAFGWIAPYAWEGVRAWWNAQAGGSLPEIDHGDENTLFGVWEGGWFPLSWVVLMPLMASVPLTVQRRLVEGVWLAWVVLAMRGLEGPVGAQQSWRHPRLWRALLLLLLPSTLILLVGGLREATVPHPPLFRPAEEVRLFEFLQSKEMAGSVVLAAEGTSNALPAWAPVYVLIGHGPESVRSAEIMPRIEAFFRASTSDEERLALLKQFQVRYLIWGPLEQALGTWDPRQAPYLEQVYRRGAYFLFLVRAVP